MDAISVLSELCSGCLSCAMACSLSREGSSSPALSRIQVKEWGEIAVYLPVVCQHCEDAPCISTCPTTARRREAETGAVLTDEKWCVGCKSCIYACPYGAPVIHPSTGKSMTCDLCKGKPLCVQACTVGAICYKSEGRLSGERKKAFAEKMVQSMRPGI